MAMPSHMPRSLRWSKPKQTDVSYPLNCTGHACGIGLTFAVEALDKINREKEKIKSRQALVRKEVLVDADAVGRYSKP